MPRSNREPYATGDEFLGRLAVRQLTFREDPTVPTEDPSEVARTLYETWRAAADPAVRRQLLDEQPVPGPVALRARFHFLTDDFVDLSELADASVSLDQWLEAIALEQEGDSALLANDTERAQSAFDALRATSRSLHARLVNVHALIGLGDAARQVDELDGALELYEAALTEARAIRHRFGEVRALVPLGYLALTTASATEADEIFGKAEKVAEALDERLYLANALIGRGETLQRRRRFDEGRAALFRALNLSEELGSNVAIGNAAQRLADLELRAGSRDEALPLLEKAAVAYERAGVAIGAATAADSLADLLLDAGEIAKAETSYGQARLLSAAARYRRGEAHALTGLARCYEARQAYSQARDAQQEALAIYEELDDLVGRTSAQAGLARASSGLSLPGAAISHWLAALDGVEEMRSLRERTDLQDEYRLRFSETYAGALRASIDANDSGAFVTVFESLAGRRLSGLYEQVGLRSDEAELLGQLVARADQRLLNRSHASTREERLRRIGAAALSLGLRDEARAEFDELLASAYAPISRVEARELLGSRPADTETLLLAPIPDSSSEVASLWRSSEGEIELGFIRLETPAAELLERLKSEGLRDLHAHDLAPLTDLLPRRLSERLRDRTQTLLVVPLDELWAVPFAALPLGEEMFLGELAPLLVAPSLALHQALAATPSSAPRTPRYVATWRSRTVKNHDLAPVFLDDPAWQVEVLNEGWQATEAITDAKDHRLPIIVCHGRPSSRLGHYLELEPGLPLTPAELVNAKRAPEELVLISCWGAATPGGRTGDPIAIATLALTRGSHVVAATLGELADSHQATVFTRAFVHRLRDRPMPVALRDATAHVLRDPAIRRGALRHWAPLAIFGAV